MIKIRNKEFWTLWNNGEIDKALQCTPSEERKSDRLATFLFGNEEQTTQSGVITGISLGETLFDYMMINPAAVKGIDFARSEDLSHLFSLSQFSKGVDTTTLSGDFAQLQGYVAEQMVAAELEAKGHDVEFPETSNQAGYDLLVDGQPFQVKNVATPQSVNQHFETYPDIPVYVNSELEEYFSGNPNVYVTSVSHEEVVDITKTSLDHAEDLLDFQLPWIAGGVSTVMNVKKIWKDDITVKQATVNILSDTSSRVALGALGKTLGISAGLFIFGPAGGIVGAMFGTYGGVSQGGIVSSKIKGIFNKSERQAVQESIWNLIQVVQLKIKDKITIKKKKMSEIKYSFQSDNETNEKVYRNMDERHQEEIRYISNKYREIEDVYYLISEKGQNILELLPNLMSLIVQTGVHPVAYQRELISLQKTVESYRKKL